MLAITITPTTVRLGDSCQILASSKEPVEKRFFVQYQGVFYPTPLKDWTQSDTCTFFPEAPGEYALNVQWRSPDGRLEWQTHSFFVESELVKDDGPQMVEVDENLRLWSPSRWEATYLYNYEAHAVAFMREVIQKDWVVYDIGANMGLYSILAARMIGANGFVYSIEANPVCLYFLRMNLANNLEGNYQILPAAVTQADEEVSFTVNYGNSNLGLEEHSTFYAAKTGHQISVQGHAISSLVDLYQWQPPNFLKIDVEGAEASVIRGLGEVFETARPFALIEIHGRKAAVDTFSSMEHLPYRFKALNDSLEFSNAKDLLDWFPNKVLQIGCTPVEAKQGLCR